MAKEWYLLKTPHVQLSGYESDALNDFAQEGFDEILDSGIAVDVELCNYDLSECKQIRAVILNNVQDTKLKSLVRNILLPIGTCKAGMYIKYKDRYWIITGLVDDNGMYEKGVMALCNHLLTWLNDKNEVVQRWVNANSASQYNNGESWEKLYFVRTGQLLLVMPDDDECVKLCTGMRFIIDRRCKVYEKNFSDSVQCDTSNSVITYEITRADSVLYDYQDSGCQEIMAYQDEQHEDDGYYVIDGKGYWLCKKPDDKDKTTFLSSKIEYDSLEVYNGIDGSVFVSKFYDENGNEVSVTPIWNIECKFTDQLTVEYIDNAICISVDNKRLINKSFKLSLSADGYETVSETVTIAAFL